MRMEVQELVRTIQIIPKNIPIFQTTLKCSDAIHTVEIHLTRCSPSITICSERLYYRRFGLLSKYRFSKDLVSPFYNITSTSWSMCMYIDRIKLIDLSAYKTITAQQLPNKTEKQAFFCF